MLLKGAVMQSPCYHGTLVKKCSYTVHFCIRKPNVKLCCIRVGLTSFQSTERSSFLFHNVNCLVVSATLLNVLLF